MSMVNHLASCKVGRCATSNSELVSNSICRPHLRTQNMLKNVRKVNRLCSSEDTLNQMVQIFVSVDFVPSLESCVPRRLIWTAWLSTCILYWKAPERYTGSSYDNSNVQNSDKKISDFAEHHLKENIDRPQYELKDYPVRVNLKKYCE